jgi:hypothetical protein
VFPFAASSAHPDVEEAYRQMGAALKRLRGIRMNAYGYIVGDGNWDGAWVLAS